MITTTPTRFLYFNIRLTTQKFIHKKTEPNLVKFRFYTN